MTKCKKIKSFYDHFVEETARHWYGNDLLLPTIQEFIALFSMFSILFKMEGCQRTLLKTTGALSFFKNNNCNVYFLLLPAMQRDIGMGRRRQGADGAGLGF
jgi:hypothetical protein